MSSRAQLSRAGLRCTQLGSAAASSDTGLKKAIYNYMHGVGLDEDVRMWWDMPVPKTRVARRFVERALADAD